MLCLIQKDLDYQCVEAALAKNQLYVLNYLHFMRYSIMMKHVF